MSFIYIDNLSLLVLLKGKGLVRLKCPFVVVSWVYDQAHNNVYEHLEVTEVRESSVYKMEYKIKGVFYPYYLFKLPEHT